MLENYLETRKYTEEICSNLLTEDYCIQPIPEVSPPKWHLAHTSWFFETFILLPYLKGYKEYNADFSYLFNSYYQSLGERNPRNNRANFSRPSVKEIYAYRHFIDKHMFQILEGGEIHPDINGLLILGIHHEQQHQELLLTDIKFILSMNIKPPSVFDLGEMDFKFQPSSWIKIPSGNYEIGYKGDEFHWDNELGSHKQYLTEFQISSNLVTNQDFMEFMEDGGYKRFEFWHDEGWKWLKDHQIQEPLYWRKVRNQWFIDTLEGVKPLMPNLPLTHISYYEAFAYASWKGMRLPTEFEWEIASDKFEWGKRWEWTQSAYLPYPGYKRPNGAIGEYNGKFMVNQMVLRGASIATPKNHSRKTYRNFFHPPVRTQFTGIRLVQG